MNFSRLSLAAVLAWVAYVAVGFVLYHTLLQDLWSREGAPFLPPARMRVEAGLVASLAGLFVFTYVYAKGYEGGDGLQEGLRFGVLVGLLLVCLATSLSYAAMPLSEELAFFQGVATVLALSVSGLVVGWVYRPEGTLTRRPR